MPRFPLQKVVNNKTKRQILKRVLQENEARQIFRKTKISYPLIRTCPFLIPWYAHGRVRIREKEMFVFRKIWRALFSWNSRFEIRRVAILQTKCPTQKKHHYFYDLWRFYPEDFIKTLSNIYKQTPRGVLKKRCSENMLQIYRRTPMQKCDFGTLFPRNTYGWLLLDTYNRWQFFQLGSFIGVKEDP